MLFDKYPPQRRVIMKKISLLMTLCSLASMALSGCSCAGNGSCSCNCSTSEPTTSVPSSSESTSTTPIIEKYTVSFKNFDDSLLTTSIVEKGGTAIYEGSTPIRPEDEQYTYSFKGWDKSLENITSDCVRVAQFNATKKPVVHYYTVTFKNYDESILEQVSVKEGSNATYSGPTPTRAETSEYSYTFTGWDQPLTNITSDCVRVAQYTETKKPTPTYYLVSFKNYDATLLYETYVIEGGDATYEGATPTREETVEYSYSFIGWDKPLTNITSDCVRIAQYSSTKKPTKTYYTVTFKNYDETILQQVSVEEGKTAIYSGNTPIRPSTPEFTFAFTGWDQPLTNITSDCVRIAQFSHSNVEYTVKFYSYDDQLLYTDVVYYMETASYYGDTPTRPASSKYTYTFAGWDKQLTNVTKSFSTKPLFDANGKQISVTVKPGNGEDDYNLNLTYGEQYDLGTPDYPGFTFLGWYAGDTLIPTTGTWEYEISALSAKWGTGYFEFVENTDETYKVSLTDEGKKASEIVIPSSFNNKAVTSMADYFTRDNLNITKVSIPGTIKTIPANSFLNCKNLSEVSLSEGLETIEGNAFSYTKIEKIEIPSTCKSIGNSAFYGSTSLYHIYLPSSVTSMGTYAFNAINADAYICMEHTSVPSWATSWISSTPLYTYTTKVVEDEDYTYVLRNMPGGMNATILRLADELKQLDSFTVPSDIEGISNIRIGQRLFFNNLFIKNVNLTNVTRIGNYAFQGCSNLTNVTFSDSLTFIGNYAFRYCTALNSIVIPDSVTEIQGYAFDGCSNLTYIYIPKTTTTIGSYAFDDCDKSIIYTNAHSKNSGWESNYKGGQAIYYDYVSNDETADFSYVVQSYLGEKYVTISNLKASAKEKNNIVIPDTIEEISDIRLASNLFSGLTSLVSIDLGSGVKSISLNCFASCTNLESVILHDGVTSIGQNAFNKCSNLKNINMPASLTSIGRSAFDYCTSLREIVIPLNVSTIDSYAFDVMGKVSLLIEASVAQPNWASNWYGSSTSNKQFIYDYVSSGVSGDFKYAKASNGLTDTIHILGLTSESTNVNLVVPDIIEGISNIKIAKDAFNGNSLIKSIDLGNSVTMIGTYAFKDCISLRSVIIPLSCSIIKNSAFNGCSTECVINCVVESLPSTWESGWNNSNCQVVWGYTR